MYNATLRFYSTMQAHILTQLCFSPSKALLSICLPLLKKKTLHKQNNYKLTIFTVLLWFRNHYWKHSKTCTDSHTPPFSSPTSGGRRERRIVKGKADRLRKGQFTVNSNRIRNVTMYFRNNVTWNTQKLYKKGDWFIHGKPTTQKPALRKCPPHSPQPEGMPSPHPQWWCETVENNLQVLAMTHILAAAKINPVLGKTRTLSTPYYIPYNLYSNPTPSTNTHIVHIHKHSYHQ